MNPTSSNLLTSCRMDLRLSRVYLLSFYLICLNDGSIPNLCSTTSLGILDISIIFHAKTSRFSQRKLMSVSSYLGLSFGSILSFFSGSAGLARISLLSPSSVVPSSFYPTLDRRVARQRLRQCWWPSILWSPRAFVGWCWPEAWMPMPSMGHYHLMFWPLGLVPLCCRSAQHVIRMYSHMPTNLADRLWWWWCPPGLASSW
jgi:hypothetical protein